MFTFRPGKNGNGHKNGNGGGSNGNGHTGQNGHNGNGYRNGNGNGNGNGHHAAIETVLGPAVHWSGKLNGNGGVRIEGSFDGSIKINGPLVIAEGARVTSDEIRATAVSVAGTVKSNIIAEKVEILTTGRIYGDLTTGAFASEEGAFLRGQIVMQEPAAVAEVVA